MFLRARLLQANHVGRLRLRPLKEAAPRGRPDAVGVERYDAHADGISSFAAGYCFTDDRFFAHFLAEERRIEQTGEAAADERRQPEEPELRKRKASGEDRRPGAARRIYRRIVDRNADEMDECQRKSDRYTCKSNRCAFVGSTEDHREERKRADDLDDQCRHHWIAAW